MGDVIPLRRFGKPSPARRAVDWEYVAKQVSCSRSTADDSDGSRGAGPAFSAGDSVPRDGIEPPTRGFSVPVLGWRSPVKSQRKRAKRAERGTPAGQRGAK